MSESPVLWLTDARIWLVPQNGTPVSGTAGPVGPMR
jgi:hypothetical protein